MNFQNLRKYKFIFAFISVWLFALFIFFQFHQQILAPLLSFSKTLHSWGVFGFLFLIFLIFCASFPPIVGYGTLLFLCGFMYGFPLGLIPAFIGAMLGSTTCFVLTRKYFYQRAQKVQKNIYFSFIPVILNSWRLFKL